MNAATIVAVACRRILASKTRSTLTLLGVVIGVASLVAMVSIAQGATSGINSSLSALGGQQVTVTAKSTTGLTEADAAALAALSGVQTVSYQAGTDGSVTAGTQQGDVEVTGVSPTYAATAQPDVAAGSFLSPAPIAQQSTSVVLSGIAATDLHLDGTDLGGTVTVAGRPFQLVGILADSGGFASSGTAYIPLGTARTMFARTPYLSAITVQAASPDQVGSVFDSVETTLKDRYHVTDDDAEFSVVNQASILDTITSIQTVLQILLGGIASISLIVGGIGIMNIMLVSVRERTKEIGIRRAIGATRAGILLQFLTEAVVLAVAGGLIGLVIGIGLSAAVAAIGGWDFAISGWVLGVAGGFSALVGVLFGVWPARTAARLQPVEALRYE